jgi:hypothetical protein
LEIFHNQNPAHHLFVERRKFLQYLQQQYHRTALGRARMKGWISAAGAVIVALAASVLMMDQAWAHGTTENPTSRALNCFLEGAENPTSATCQAAHAVGGAQPLDD